MTATVLDLEQHVRSLAAYHDIELTLKDELPSLIGWSDPLHHRVLGPVIRDDAAYAAVMHEMGHVVASGGFNYKRLDLVNTQLDLALRIDEEYAAWQWAKDNALRWTPAMQAAHDYAFGTYTRALGKAA